MSLIESTLFGTVDKVQIAIERLRAFEPKAGYYLAFSGGKDSVTLYRLAQMAGVKFDAHYNITTVDPPELVQFIKREYPEVQRHHPRASMWELILEHNWPPMCRQRYCCEELKEGSGHGRIVLTGIRWAESNRRRQRRMTETCYKDGTITYVHPIIDWLTADIWEFIKRFDVAYCGLYDEGFSRLGCVLCPMASNPQRQMERWPKIAAQYIKTFDRLIHARNNKGQRITFTTGQQMFDWWIRRHTKTANPGQAVMFE